MRRTGRSIAGRGSRLKSGSRWAAASLLLFLLTFQIAVANHELLGRSGQRQARQVQWRTVDGSNET